MGINKDKVKDWFRNQTVNQVLLAYGNKIEIWIDHVDRTWGKIRSVATDNELFHNNKINRLFEDNDIEHYVEDSGYIQS